MGMTSGNRRSTQLLVEMDGFNAQKGVIIMAATNRPEILDPALLRPGRFDRQVLVDRPDLEGRKQILRVHAKDLKLAPDVNMDRVAGMTPGLSGADLANLANEASLLAARHNRDAVTIADFEEAVERLAAGLEKKSRVMTPEERKRAAYHEMGHAMVAELVGKADPVQKVSIIPRGIGALGYTLQRPTEDRYLLAKSELEDRITVLLGGRAAEELVFEEVSTGAQNDLQRATDMARGDGDRIRHERAVRPPGASRGAPASFHWGNRYRALPGPGRSARRRRERLMRRWRRSSQPPTKEP